MIHLYSQEQLIETLLSSSALVPSSSSAAAQSVSSSSYISYSSAWIKMMIKRLKKHTKSLQKKEKNVNIHQQSELPHGQGGQGGQGSQCGSPLTSTPGMSRFLHGSDRSCVSAAKSRKWSSIRNGGSIICQSLSCNFSAFIKQPQTVVHGST